MKFLLVFARAPSGALNANVCVERFNRTLREEALDHFIFLNEGHITRACREYIEFYNEALPGHRTNP